MRRALTRLERRDDARLVRVSRRGVEKDERALAIDRAEIDRLGKDRDDERIILERGFHGRMVELLDGQTVASGPKGVKAGSKLNAAMLEDMPKSQWQQIAVKDDAVQKLVEAQVANFDSAVRELQARFNDKVARSIAKWYAAQTDVPCAKLCTPGGTSGTVRSAGLHMCSVPPCSVACGALLFRPGLLC